MKNSKVTLDDLRRAEYIFGGPAVNLLKGKTFYSPVNTSRPIERIPLPPHILKTHPSVTVIEEDRKSVDHRNGSYGDRGRSP